MLERALAEAEVRFGPEQAALEDLLMSAAADFQRSYRVGEDVSRSLQASAESAIPKVQESYKQAQDYLEDAMDSAGGGGKGGKEFKRAMEREDAAVRSRLESSMAGAVGELQARKVQAEAARAFGLQQALGQYMSAQEKIHSRRQALAGQRGAFITATKGELTAAADKARQEARDRAFDRQMAMSRFDLDKSQFAESQRANRADEATAARNAATAERNAATTAAKAAREASGAGGPKPMSPEGQVSTKAKIDTAYTVLSRLRGQPPAIFDATVRAMAAGDTRKGRLPKIGNPLLVHAAAELVRTRKLASPTYHRLKGAGFAVPRPWMPLRPTTRSPFAGVRAGGTVRAR